MLVWHNKTAVKSSLQTSSLMKLTIIKEVALSLKDNKSCNQTLLRDKLSISRVFSSVENQV